MGANTAQLLLVTLSATQEFLRWQTQVSLALQKAQTEGRDITAEELASFRAASQAAVDGFLTRTGGA